MGREVKRVPLDFDVPLGASYHDHVYEKHTRKKHGGDPSMIITGGRMMGGAEAVVEMSKGDE